MIFTLKRNAELILLHPAHQPAQLKQRSQERRRKLIREKPCSQQKYQDYDYNRPLYPFELTQKPGFGLHSGQRPVRCHGRLLVIN
ncbi:hypothetical protein D3C75_608680 [compost metagenome]